MNHLFYSERLGFRQWRPGDLPHFMEMNADEEVMEFFPSVLKPEETSDLLARMANHQIEHGYTFFAVDELETSEFIGFIGVIDCKIDLDCTPCPEIGWRLKRSAWGKGFATEGARACLKYGFDALGFDKVCSFTPDLNVRSEHVMKKLGMKKQGHFKHPKLEKDHPLEQHVLYLIHQDEFDL